MEEYKVKDVVKVLNRDNTFTPSLVVFKNAANKYGVVELEAKRYLIDAAKSLGSGWKLTTNGYERVANIFNGIRIVKGEYITEKYTTLSDSAYRKIVNGIYSVLLGNFEFDEENKWYTVSPTQFTVLLGNLMPSMNLPKEEEAKPEELPFYFGEDDPNAPPKEEKSEPEAKPRIYMKRYVFGNAGIHPSKPQEQIDKEKALEELTKAAVEEAEKKEAKPNPNILPSGRDGSEYFRAIAESDEVIESLFSIYGHGDCICPTQAYRELILHEDYRANARSLMVSKDDFMFILRSKDSASVQNRMKFGSISTANILKNLCRALYEKREVGSQVRNKAMALEDRILDLYTDPINPRTKDEIAIELGISRSSVSRIVSGLHHQRGAKRTKGSILDSIKFKHPDLHQGMVEKLAQYNDNELIALLDGDKKYEELHSKEELTVMKVIIATSLNRAADILTLFSREEAKMLMGVRASELAKKYGLALWSLRRAVRYADVCLVDKELFNQYKDYTDETLKVIYQRVPFFDFAGGAGTMKTIKHIEAMEEYFDLPSGYIDKFILDCKRLGLNPCKGTRSKHLEPGLV